MFYSLDELLVERRVVLFVLERHILYLSYFTAIHHVFKGHRMRIDHFSELGVEIIEEIPEPFDASGWEVLTRFAYLFENAQWQRVVDSVLLWNVPTAKFWEFWEDEKDTLKFFGFQARPNKDAYAQPSDAKWLVYFNRHQYLDAITQISDGREL